MNKQEQQDPKQPMKAASKQTARRGGLGRGLGALIPSVQESRSTMSDLPVDVLFPKTSGSGVVRGGSAKDLLSPRTKAARNVSRETISTPPVFGDDVSRETISTLGSSGGLVQVPGTTFGLIPLEEIIPNTRQPRQVFELTDLNELSESIREVGVLQPIVVRPIDLSINSTPALIAAVAGNPRAKYELIMGERRLRASKLAELDSVPAIIRLTEDEKLLLDALLENLHRAQLNPLEEAAAYEQLLVDFSCTQEELARRVAKSRPQIANTLRLLNLPPTVQRKVAAAVLSAGHARALLGLSNTTEMEVLAQRIVSEGLSVRATEEIVRFGKRSVTSAQKSKVQGQRSALALQVMGQVSGFLETQVTITEGKKKGKIVIDFADQADLERISGLLGGV